MEVTGVDLDQPIKGLEDALDRALGRFGLRVEATGNDDYALARKPIGTGAPWWPAVAPMPGALRSLRDVVDAIRDGVSHAIAWEARRPSWRAPDVEGTSGGPSVSEGSSWGQPPKA